jgi:hypothetical protein
MWYLQSHFVCFKLCISSIENLLSINFERFTDYGGFLIFPHLSNSLSPPALRLCHNSLIKKEAFNFSLQHIIFCSMGFDPSEKRP